MALLPMFTWDLLPLTMGLLVILCLVWIRYVLSHYTVFTELGIPGPKPKFLFGNVGDFIEKFPLDVFKDWAKKYGKVFGFYEGVRPSVVISCPKLAQEILVKHFNKFSARPIINPFQHDYQQLSLQNTRGSLWKRQRQAVSAGMTARSIKEMLPVMSDVTNQLMEWFDQSNQRNPDGFYIDDIAERFSLDWFAQAALGYHSDALTYENNVLLRYMRASHESVSPENAWTGLAKLFPLLTSLLKPFDKSHKVASRLQTDDVTNFIKSFQVDPTKSSQKIGHNIIFNLMTKKVSAHERHKHSEAGEPSDTNKVGHTSRKILLEESEVIGQVSGLIGGGIGPVSSALIFCIYCLAIHGEEQERLREELDDVTQSKNSIDLEEIYKLEAMERFIYETLRVYPVAPGVSRECLEECTIDGVHFKPGMVVRVMASTMYSQEEYFSNPSKFDPERFHHKSPEDTETCPQPNSSFPLTPQSSFMPFGLGPRMCVGQRLAMVALKLTLARLLQSFVISASDVTQIPLQVTLRPFLVARDGVHIKVTKR